MNAASLGFRTARRGGAPRTGSDAARGSYSSAHPKPYTFPHGSTTMGMVKIEIQSSFCSPIDKLRDLRREPLPDATGLKFVREGSRRVRVVEHCRSCRPIPQARP